MSPGLHEHGVGDNRDHTGGSDAARQGVLRTVQQNAHHQITFDVDIDLHRLRLGSATAAGGIVIDYESFRHFSSPGYLEQDAKPAPAPSRWMICAESDMRSAAT